MGLAIISTVLVPASSYDLTDLTTAKDELKISASDTTNDAWLGRAISEVSDDIAKYCNRVFPIETVQDVILPDRDAYPYQTPGGVAPLQLSRWPIVPTMLTLLTNADTPSGNILPFASTVGLSAGVPASWPGLPSASVVQAVAAGSVTLSAPVFADVPPGVAVTFGLDVTVADINGCPRQLCPNRDFLVDAKTGQLTRLNFWTRYRTLWDPLTTTVTYQAGFATIPNGLVGIALEVLTQRFQERGRDPFLKSQEQPTLGTETYWVGTRPGIDGIFSTGIQGRLDTYRVPVVA